MVQTVDPRLNLNLAVIIETEDPSMARGDIRVEMPVGSIGRSVDVSHRCAAVASSGSVQLAKRREKCAQFCGNKLISALVLACTMFAMFSEDIRLLSPPTTDTPFHVFTAIAFLIFTVELIFTIYINGSDKWFYTFLDFVATLSLIPDLWFFQAVMHSSSCDEMYSNGARDALVLVRASRAARSGIRLGRLVKLTRLIRITRLVKLMRCRKYAHDGKSITSAREVAGDMSQKMSEIITLKVIMIVLIMNFTMPFMEITIVDTLPEQGLGVIQSTPPLSDPNMGSAFDARYECPGSLVGNDALTLRGTAVCGWRGRCASPRVVLLP